MSAHPIGVCVCKGTEKIANVQGLCDFFYKKINVLENKQAPERRLVMR